jgi:PAS domain S-box-containing protein
LKIRPDAIFVEDLTGTVLDANACGVRVARHEAGATRRQKCRSKNWCRPGRRESARADFKKLAAGQISWAEGESLRADGSRGAGGDSAWCAIEFEGQPALLFHVRDVSERHAAETALRSSETLFRSVWENSVDGMRLTDDNGNIVAVNDAYCRLVGMPQEQLEGGSSRWFMRRTTDWEKMLANHRNNFRAGISWQKSEKNFAGCTTVARWSLRSRTATWNPAASRACCLSLFRDVTVP